MTERSRAGVDGRGRVVRRRGVVVAVLALAAAVIVLVRRPAEVVPDAGETAGPARVAAQTGAVPGAVVAGVADGTPGGASELAERLNDPAGDIVQDLAIVEELLAAWRGNFPGAGNPVGDNREITAALTGANRLRVAFVPRDHRAVSSRGELTDRWGTPFFFHALSGEAMDVRSAGPDRELWTGDDVVTGLEGR